MKKDNLDLEMEEMLKNARPLSEIDLERLAEANRAISRDPRHVAAVMKGVFVNNILTAMEEQGLNKNQLAMKWGKSRQYLNSVLDRENPGNFTIDTIVSLSMTLGLIPQRIRLEPMDTKAGTASSLSMLKVAEAPGEPYRTKPMEAAGKSKVRKSK